MKIWFAIFSCMLPEQKEGLFLNVSQISFPNGHSNRKCDKILGVSTNILFGFWNIFLTELLRYCIKSHPESRCKHHQSRETSQMFYLKGVIHRLRHPKDNTK